MRPYRRRDSDERTQMMEAMIEHRIRTHDSMENIAREFGVCVRTVKRWKATEEWRAIENKWRKIMREEARTEIGQIASNAIGVLTELMNDEKVSVFTRMSSAKTLLELSGVADEIEENKVDHHDELLEFLKQAKRPSITAKIADAEVLDGGLLPPEFTALAETIDAEYTYVSEPMDGSLDTELESAVGGSTGSGGTSGGDAGSSS